LAGSTPCGITAYKGATRVAATIGSITGLPAGMTASIASNGTTAPVITFTVTTSMKTASGTVNIPVTVDGKTFTKVFSYSIAFKGTTGATGQQGIPGESLFGKMLYKDPTFKSGVNGVSVYNNSGNGTVTVTRIAKPSDAPTDSSYCLQVKTAGTASPVFGGVVQSIQSRANAVFVQKIIAKIDVGYTINAASNSMGSEYKDEWLTSRAGTGKYETYLRKVTCGASGSFSSGGHIYLTGSPTPTSASPLIWHIAYITCFDETADGYADIDITTKDSFATQLGFTNFEALKANALTKGPLIKAGLINADVIDVNTLAGKTVFADKLLSNTAFLNSVKANTLAVGGFTIQDYKIIGGSDFGSGAGIKITSTTSERSFRAYKDASHYVEMFYRSASDWGLKGVDGNTGKPVFQLGSTNKVGPFNFTVDELVSNVTVGSNNYDMRLAAQRIAFLGPNGQVLIGNTSGLGGPAVIGINGGDFRHQAGTFYASTIQLQGGMKMINNVAITDNDGNIIIKNGCIGGVLKSVHITTSSVRLIPSFFILTMSSTNNPVVMFDLGFKGQIICLLNYGGKRIEIRRNDGGGLATYINAECSVLMYCTGSTWLPIQVGGLYYT